MTLSELEIELVKRGIVVFSTVRRNGVWHFTVGNPERDTFGVGIDENIEAAVRKAFGEYDGIVAASFCAGKA
jgi:hypothetical protein